MASAAVPGRARWNGSAWEALGAGIGNSSGDPNSVCALAVVHGEVNAAGLFPSIPGSIVNGVARWDGILWRPLAATNGTGVGGFGLPRVDALVAIGDDLHLAGSFDSVGSVLSVGIARWRFDTDVIFASGFD